MSVVRPAPRAPGVAAAIAAAPLFPRVLVRLRWPLGLALSVAAAANPAAAQTQIDPIVITGSREPEPLDRVTADLVVIDAERIRASPADSVEDLLRREAGLQLSRNGGSGHSAGVFIRGASASSTLVLIDGVRVGSATAGQAALEGIDLSQIERIEVLRGPGSSLYGADAVGGVVQIFMRKGDGAPRVTAHAAVGGKVSRELDAGVSGSQGPFDYAVQAGHDRSGGVSTLRPNDQFGNYNPDADGFARNSSQLQLGFTPAPGHRLALHANESRLDAQYDGSQFAPPDFTQDASPDFRSHLKTRVVSLDYRGQLNSLWTTTAQVARDDDQLRSGGTQLSRFDTRRDQLTWQNALAVTPDQQLVLAIERLNERANADDYAAPASRHNTALLLGYSGGFATAIGRQQLQVDLRRDDSSVYGGVTTGRVGWSLGVPQLLQGLTLRALAGTTFRAPSFNDLVYPNYGVASIRPERGRSVEVGASWQRDGSDLALALYRNKVRDLIQYEPDRTFCPADPGYDFGCAGNVGRARLQGATLSAGQRWGDISLRGTVDLLDATDADTGKRLDRRAAHQESLSADYAPGDWSVGVALLSLGRRPDSGAQLGAYVATDLHASWRFAPQWRAEAKLLNATDHDIEPARDYQALGRQAWLGLRYDGQGL